MFGKLTQNFQKDPAGVWIPKGGVQAFGYTDGAWVEQYLTYVFNSESDLSSTSDALERHIKDWNTEYHLSRKRKDLLAGLDHPKDSTVLEIGCGCGAITRFLGETYDTVLAVEGSYERAKLARLRTRDLGNVEVVCSPYQALGLEGFFDLVFCIGVLEYAPTYVDSADPFDAALSSMKAMLKSQGALVLAIENKNGLKYYANSTEDHSGTFFEGVENYPRMRNKFETFGRVELEQLLDNYFSDSKFYYPFPDYKMPECLVSEQAFQHLDLGEMVGAMVERDYAFFTSPHFDTRLAWPQIMRNQLGRHMSNSFLVVSGSESSSVPSMGGRLATLFNSSRRKDLVSRTDVSRRNGEAVAEKAISGGEVRLDGGLMVHGVTDKWLDLPTVAFETFTAAHSKNLTLGEQLAAVSDWWRHVLTISSAGMVPDDYVDAVWHNCCREADGSIVTFDNEIKLEGGIPAHLLLIRAAFNWGVRYGKEELSLVGSRSLLNFIERVAGYLGVTLTRAQIREFIEFEAMLQSRIGQVDERAAARKIRLRLNLPLYRQVDSFIRGNAVQVRRAKNLIRKFT